MNKGLLIALVTSRNQCRGRIVDGCGGNRAPKDRRSTKIPSKGLYILNGKKQLAK